MKQKRFQGFEVNSSEEQEQRILIRWVRLMATRDGRFARLFHVPNGGWRHPATAARMKSAGVVPGVPDLLMPVPSRGFVGLAIEMKSKNGRLTAAQKDWLDYLWSVGWCVRVCHSFEEAQQALRDYLEIANDRA